MGWWSSKPNVIFISLDYIFLYEMRILPWLSFLPKLHLFFSSPPDEELCASFATYNWVKSAITAVSAQYGANLPSWRQGPRRWEWRGKYTCYVSSDSTWSMDETWVLRADNVRRIVSSGARLHLGASPGKIRPGGGGQMIKKPPKHLAGHNYRRICEVYTYERRAPIR